LKRTVAELLTTGTYDSTVEGATTYADANRLMASRQTS
jgi:hypothetical protein